MRVFLAHFLPLGLAIAGILPSVEKHGIIPSLVQRSKEVHVSLDVEAYMNDVSSVYRLLLLPNLLTAQDC